MHLCQRSSQVLLETAKKLARQSAAATSRRWLWTPSPELTASSTVESVKEEFRNIGGGYVFLNTSDVHTLGIARLCFGNPFRKNAISGRMMADLHDALVELQNLSRNTDNNESCVKAVVFMSDDPTFFCSGGDLDTVRAILNHEGGYKMATLMQDVHWRLAFSDFLTVALVRGRAIGGGAELTTATDLRVFSPDASLSFVQSSMSISTGWGGGSRLAAIVGRRSALRLLLEKGSRVNPIEAKEIGLCDHITEHAGQEAYDEAESWVRNQFLTTGSEVIKAIKSTVSDCDKRLLKDSWENEKIEFARLWAGPGHTKAMKLNIKH